MGSAGSRRFDDDSDYPQRAWQADDAYQKCVATTLGEEGEPEITFTCTTS